MVPSLNSTSAASTSAAQIQLAFMNGLGSMDSVFGDGSAMIFLAGLGISTIAAPHLSTRFGSDRRLVFASLVATFLIVAVTWPLGTIHAIRHLDDTFNPGAILSWWRESWGTRTYKIFAKQDSRRNVALFVPAGFLWILLMRRRGTKSAARRVIAALCGLSFLVESLQAVSGVRDADTRDLVTNTVGAAIGAVTAMLWIAMHRRFGPAALNAEAPQIS